MMIKFVCTYEGWQKEYDAVSVPNIGHDVNFPKKDGIYSVVNVVHDVISLTQRNARTVPSVKVYVRPHGLDKGTTRLTPVKMTNTNATLFASALDQEKEKRRVAKLPGGDYCERY